MAWQPEPGRTALLASGLSPAGADARNPVGVKPEVLPASEDAEAIGMQTMFGQAATFAA
jgi:hypothetical protein